VGQVQLVDGSMVEQQQQQQQQQFLDVDTFELV